MTGQAEFAAALLDPARPVPAGLVDPMGRPAGKRFAVYRNNVAVSLTRALEQGFPVVRALVGEAFFAAMAGVFLRTHPPRDKLLMLYGTEMPEFLAHFPPVAHLPYLADVARLELALRESYHAADTPPLPTAVLAGLAPAALMAARVTLAPALRLIRSDWPVLSIWLANTRGTPPPCARAAEDVLILRPAFDPEPRLLPAPGAAFVAAVMQGQTVARAVDSAGPTHDLTATLSMLIAGGALTGLSKE